MIGKGSVGITCPHIARVHQGTGAFNKTDMAQGQRAGLITPRSLDRNGSPVSNSSHRIGASRHWSTKTGMAQRKRAGLITPRTYDRNVLPVSNSSHRIGASRHWSTKTDMAQRQRAWLITTRTLDRNGLSVLFFLQKK